MDKTSPATSSGSPAYDKLRLLLNFRCLPYIDIETGTNELQWLYDSGDQTVMQILQDSGYRE